MSDLINVTTNGIYTTSVFYDAVDVEYSELRGVIERLLIARYAYDKLVREYKQAKMNIIRDNDAKSLGPNEEARKAVVEGLVAKEYDKMVEAEQTIKNLETEAELVKLSIEELKLKLKVVELSR